MGEPARQIDENENEQPLTAYQRAQQQWGLQPTGLDNDDSDSPAETSDEKKSAREKADSRWGMDGDALKEAEKDPSSPKATDGDRSESSSIGGATQGPWLNKAAALKGRSTKRRNILAGSGIGLLVGGGIGFFSIIQGPLQIIHFSQLLQRFHFSNNEMFMDSRTGNMLRYLRNSDAPSRRNLGFLGNKIADKHIKSLEAAGMEFDFTNPRGAPSRRVTSITIDPSSESGQRMLASLKRNDIDFTKTSNGKFRVNVEGSGGTRRARLVMGAGVDALGLNRVSAAIASRNLKHRMGVNFKPLSNKVREASQDRRAYREKRRREMADADRNGTRRPPTTLRVPVDDSGNPTDRDGNPLSDSAAQDTREAVDAGNDVREGARQGGLSEARNRARSKNVGRGVGVVGVVCAARAVGDAAESLKYTNIILPMARIGMRVIATGGQTMAGMDMNSEELGVMIDSIKGWSSARSIQYELGEPMTGPDIPTAAKPSRVGDKHPFFNIIDNVPGLGAACSPAGQVALLAFSGIANIAAEVALRAGGAITGINPTEWIMEQAVRMIAGEEVDVEAEGPELANYANIGARLAARDAGAAIGGAELTSQDLALLNQERSLLEAANRQNHSFFARIFNIHDINSILGRMMIANPSLYSAQNVLRSAANLPLSLMSTLGSGFSNLLPITHAQTEPYDYGFDMAGFTVGEMDHPKLNDPYYVASVVEPNLDDWRQKYRNCFGTWIDEAGRLITMNEAENEKRYTDPEPVCDDPHRADDPNKEPSELQYFRMYLAYKISEATQACFENIDVSVCEEVGLGETGTLPPAPGEELGDLKCPANLEAHPTESGYFRMPASAPNSEYTVYSAVSRRWGSRELICVVHTVALAYNDAMQGKSKLRIGNLNTPPGRPSRSHRWGVGIDVSAAGEIQAASHNKSWKGRYSKDATVTLGKLFVDTGKIKNIWWCPPGDSSIQEIKQYAESKGTPINIKCISGHSDHFHVDLKDEYRLQAYSP